MGVRKVGSARIVREIGRGGMGVVYEAFQEGLDRPVAVKALDAKLARSKEVVERFRREGRAYARLRHEAIVAVHDLVETDEQLFLVTEVIDGADLARVLGEGDAGPHRGDAAGGERAALREDAGEVRPVHELGHEVEPVVLLDEVVDLHDRLVPEPGVGAPLSPETLDELLLTGEPRVERLHGDGPVERLLVGLVHDAHPAAPDLAHDP